MDGALLGHARVLKTEVEQQERLGCLVPAVQRAPVLASQHRPRFVQPVTPFDDQAFHLGPAVERQAPWRLFTRGCAERLDVVEQVMPHAIPLEELKDGESHRR